MFFKRLASTDNVLAVSRAPFCNGGKLSWWWEEKGSAADIVTIESITFEASVML